MEKRSARRLPQGKVSMSVREDIFWIACPKCGEKFYCDIQLRHSSIKLMCPKCHHRFLDSESPQIIE